MGRWVARSVGMLFLALSLTRCATSGSDPETLFSTTGEDTIRVMFFSAPWCGNCGPMIKELKQILETELAANSKNIKPVIVVVSGKSGSEKPSQAVTEEYVAKLGVGFEYKADFWKTGAYASYYGKNNLLLPAAVAIGSSGSTKIFASSKTLVQDITTFLQGAMK